MNRGDDRNYDSSGYGGKSHVRDTSPPLNVSNHSNMGMKLDYGLSDPKSPSTLLERLEQSMYAANRVLGNIAIIEDKLFGFGSIQEIEAMKRAPQSLQDFSVEVEQALSQLEARTNSILNRLG